MKRRSRSRPNGMFRLVKGPKIDRQKVEVGKCMRGTEGKLCLREKESCVSERRKAVFQREGELCLIEKESCVSERR